jgi:MFS family permease
VGLYGLKVPLLIDAVSYLAVVVAGLLLRTRRASVRVEHPVAGTWRTRSDPLLTGIVAMVGALIMTVNITAVALVFLVRDTMHGSATAYGLIEATWTGAMLIGGWYAASRVRADVSLGRTLVVLHAATAVLIALAGLVPAIGWLFVLWLVGGALNGVENNFLGVLAARRVPAAVRGRFFAQFGAVANGANLIGFALAGVLVDRFAPGPVITAGGVAGLVVVLVLARRVWRGAQSPSSGVVASPQLVA